MTLTLQECRDIWRRKPVLRAIYSDYYRRIKKWTRPGLTLEIGGGAGNLKEFFGDVVTTDIQFADWLDAVADAQRLPFRDDSFANILLFDVLHHIEVPRLFLEEAQRVLEPGGRLVVLEPEVTPFSRMIYTLFHPEPIDLRVDPLATRDITRTRDPYAANQAIPSLLFGRDRARVHSLFPELQVIAYERLGLLAYPLSGGFRPWSLVPASLVPFLLWVEDALMPWVGKLMAFRILGVIERQSVDAGTPRPETELAVNVQKAKRGR
jgi:SAM-dependent methyltransferase